MKERKKGEHAMVRKLFMLMAAFVLVLCMKTTTYAASTKTVNMESVGSGMYIHIGTMKRGKGTVYHRVKVKKKGIPSRNAFHYFIIMFYREELIACAIDLNSSSDNFSFGLENSISDSFWIGIK